jgi:SAM-dependent methyltransferase
MTHQFNAKTITCQNIAAGVKALQKGGFAAWYQAQVALFKHLHPSFGMSNYAAFASRTQRAQLPLASTQELVDYSVLYAGDHFARFTELLTQLKARSDQKALCVEPIQLKVFDYGCGQGLASLALMQHLAGRQVGIELHLVEPSALALQAAIAYTQAQAEHHGIQLQVHAHHCGLDQLPDELFSLQPQQSAVHLFSNVLDLASAGHFQLPVLLNQLHKMHGKHLCLAVSPTYWSGKLGFDLVKQAFPHARSWVDSESLGATAHSFRLGQGMQYHNVQGRAFAAQFLVA